MISKLNLVYVQPFRVMQRGPRHFLAFCIVLLHLMLGTTLSVVAQSVHVDLGMLEGMELRPENAFNFSVINSSGAAKNAQVKGTLKFKGSSLQATYSFHTSLQPGTTLLNRERVGNPTWQFSSPALRDLFLTYGKLPQGTYEYCVELSFPGTGGEAGGYPVEACTYQTVEDVFLINLIAPEDGAKLYEYYPMLSWVVNYPFASELTYRIRVVELKSGQNNAAAITRNNPVYQDRNVLATTTTYPVTARPLRAWQPYIWTVDAYYKGLLLGGAEPWRFTIIEDSQLVAVSRNQSYYEFATHYGETTLSAVGELRLKYVSMKDTDTLAFKVMAQNAEAEPRLLSPRSMQYGDNLFSVDMSTLHHNRRYKLIVQNKNGNSYEVPFTYYNPLFVK